MQGSIEPGAGRTLVHRLRPGEDVKLSLMSLVEASSVAAGVVLSLVGSLSSASLRFAGHDSATRLEGPFEIVSATGTVGRGGCHIHVSVADGTGTTYGGHLVDGCSVLTTVELVILDLSQTWIFERKLDQQTAYNELVVAPAGPD